MINSESTKKVCYFKFWNNDEFLSGVYLAISLFGNYMAHEENSGGIGGRGWSFGFGTKEIDSADHFR